MKYLYMNLKIFYLGFWGDPGFPNEGWLNKLMNQSDSIVNTIEEANTLFIGSFLELVDLNKVLNFKGKRILYISEPITINHFEFSKMINFLFKNRIYDAVIGCIQNKKLNKWYKYPLYQDLFEKNSSDIYKTINDYVKHVDITTKKFCTLISRHDLGNCRLKTYEIVKQFGQIDCPGVLLNNMSNKLVNTIGIPEFIKGYLFNICNENFGESHPGYITEKLMNCCLGGAIPIYYGKLDDIDKQIFNINRIIVIQDVNNLQAVNDKLNEILSSNENLERFYRQSVFEETALETLSGMKVNVLDMLNIVRG